MFQAFELCSIGEYNCSHQSMTSPSVMAELLRLPKENPALYHALSAGKQPDYVFKDTEPPFGMEDDDDSAVPVSMVKCMLSGKKKVEPRVTVDESGNFTSSGMAEGEDLDQDDSMFKPT